MTISEVERQVLAEAFGILARKLSNAAPIIEDQRGTAPALQAATPPSSPNPAVAPTNLETGVRDRWARDRKGNEVPEPEGFERIEVHIAKTEQKETHLRVTWQNHGTGYGNANCFDAKLWPHIINRTGRMTVLYVLKKGNYINVVGVRA